MRFILIEFGFDVTCKCFIGNACTKFVQHSLVSEYSSDRAQPDSTSRTSSPHASQNFMIASHDAVDHELLIHIVDGRQTSAMSSAKVCPGGAGVVPPSRIPENSESHSPSDYTDRSRSRPPPPPPPSCREKHGRDTRRKHLSACTQRVKRAKKLLFTIQVETTPFQQWQIQLVQQLGWHAIVRNQSAFSLQS